MTWKEKVLDVVSTQLPEKFCLADVYAFEEYFSKFYPNNFHIKDKIRQQLQTLRDDGYLEFVGRGEYLQLKTTIYK